MMHPPLDAASASTEPFPETPKHGFPGDQGTRGRTDRGVPAALTIAVSRETGARGGAVGRRVARKLDWPVYDQELLEYMAQDVVVRQGVVENLSPAAAGWVETCLQG